MLTRTPISAGVTNFNSSLLRGHLAQSGNGTDPHCPVRPFIVTFFGAMGPRAAICTDGFFPTCFSRHISHKLVIHQ